MLLVLITGFQCEHNCQLLGKHSSLIKFPGWCEKLDQWHWFIIFSLKKEALPREKKKTQMLTCWLVISSTCSLWGDCEAESNLKTSSSPHFVFPVSLPCSPSHIWPQSFRFPFFWPPWFFIYLQSSQPVLTSVPSRPLFFLTCPFYSVYPSLNLLSYLSLFHSWLNPFSSPSLVFPLPSNLSTFISIFHSFTVGYIFSYSFFCASAASPNLSILISIFLLFTAETSALTRETAMETNKQRGL